jgi:hypothetical protein
VFWCIFFSCNILGFAGNGYYLFSAPKLQCDAETGNSTIEKVIEVNTYYSKAENVLSSVWRWW